MKINLLYFASVRETVGIASETIEINDGTATVATLRETLQARGAPWHLLLAQNNIKFAVDQQFATPETPLRDGSEVALFPPVTGG